eukprot:7676761-Pyramimonas_sp.AAC.1
MGSPDWIRTLARRDFVNVGLEEWSRPKDPAPEGEPAVRRPRGHWMAQLKQFFAPRKLANKWDPSEQARAALRHAIIGGQWSQAKLKQYESSGYATCQRCLDCPGTLHHRLWPGPLLQQKRGAAVSADIIQAA